MFLVYGDESLDEKKERVCAVAALVGIEDAWASLEQDWKKLHGEIPFHANNCDSDRGDYALKLGEHPDERHRFNKSLYKDSITLLAESDVVGFGSAYDLAAQREAFPPPYSQPVYYQPFLDVLEAVGNFAMHRDDQVELTFDSRIESEHNAGLLYAHMRESHPENVKRFASKISFESSSKSVRIQIADLFAREAMKLLDNQLPSVNRPRRKSWLALESTGRFKVIVRSHEHFAEAKEQAQSIDAITGMNESGYSAWLEETGRVPNVTNYFEYMIRKLKGLSDEKRRELGEKLN